MTALRFFPFAGAVVAIAAVVLGIIGISTTYWFAGIANSHAGKEKQEIFIFKTIFLNN
jgi:hypothetical protein